MDLRLEAILRGFHSSLEYAILHGFDSSVEYAKAAVPVPKPRVPPICLPVCIVEKSSERWLILMTLDQAQDEQFKKDAAYCIVLRVLLVEHGHACCALRIGYYRA